MELPVALWVLAIDMIRAALTVEEALEGMKSLEPKIKNYARLVVRKGVNVKPGQEVVVQSPVECAPFARVVVAEAYASGQLESCATPSIYRTVKRRAAKTTRLIS